MTDLVGRRLLVDLQPSFARIWCGGDAFATAFVNALWTVLPSARNSEFVRADAQPASATLSSG